MIVKRIPAWPTPRHPGSVRARHVASLLDYMNSPEKQSDMRDALVAYFTREKMPPFDGERLVHLGSRHLVAKTFLGRRAEMMAIAQRATRSKNPLDHWLLSWRGGEVPTTAQVDQTVAMFVEHMKLGTHQCIYAVHGDTRNIHVHIALNRYDPLSNRMVSAAGGFAIDEAHKTVAKIVAHFGWEPEARANWIVKDNVLVPAPHFEPDRTQRPPALRMEANALENRTGQRSRQRIAQEDAWPLIRDAKSWPDMHRRLAKAGFEYVRTRTTNGAAILINGEGVKASDVSRGATISALQRQFGMPFEPKAVAQNVLRSPRNLFLPEAFRAEEFGRKRERWKDLKTPGSSSRRAAADLGREIDRLCGLQPNPSADDALLLAAFRKVKRDLYTSPPPDLESWLHEEEEAWFAERWRKRRQQAPIDWAITGTRNGNVPPRVIRGYIGHRCREGVRYAKPGEGTAFIDRGERICVVPDKGDDAIRAALDLAAVKFTGALKITGSPQFRDRAYRIALEMGLGSRFSDPEFRTWCETTGHRFPAVGKSGLEGSPGKLPSQSDGRSPVTPELRTHEPAMRDGEGERTPSPTNFASGLPQIPAKAPATIPSRSASNSGSAKPPRSSGTDQTDHANRAPSPSADRDLVPYGEKLDSSAMSGDAKENFEADPGTSETARSPDAVDQEEAGGPNGSNTDNEDVLMLGWRLTGSKDPNAR